MSLLILLVAGFLGLIAHWFKKWARGQTADTFFEYMRVNRKNSLASVVTLIGVIVGFYTAGDVVISNQIMAMAFGAGFIIDSTANKSSEDS